MKQHLRLAFVAALAAQFAGAAVWSRPAAAAEANIPVLVPVTGFLSNEGTSQRDGAVLALKEAPASIKVTYDVEDTGTAPENAVNALERALGNGPVTAVVASMLGTQMLAMMPVALQYRVPLVTISGTATITEKNNPYIFRFFPQDAVTGEAHVLFAVEERKFKKPALIYQTDAYGQSGHAALVESLKKLGVTPVYEDSIDVSIKDLVPVLSKAKAAGADVILSHLHGGSTALLLKAAKAINLGVAIISDSAIPQPSVAALLEPAELAGVCGITGSSPSAAETPAMAKFLAAYRAEFHLEPDAFSVGQYDGTRMVLKAVAEGAKSAADVTKALSTTSYAGLAMTYKSNGHGDMAHSAVVICYDGKTRVPKVVKHYDFAAN